MLATVLPECRVDVTSVGGAGELAAVLAQRGVAFFEGVRGEQQLLQLAARLGRIVPHRDSNPTGITMLADHGEARPRPGQAGFSRQPLAPHDGSSTGHAGMGKNENSSKETSSTTKLPHDTPLQGRRNPQKWAASVGGESTKRHQLNPALLTHPKVLDRSRSTHPASDVHIAVDIPVAYRD